MHGSTAVSDLGANSSKVWTFGASGVSQGLATAYEERGPGGVAVMHTDYTWSADGGERACGDGSEHTESGVEPGAEQQHADAGYQWESHAIGSVRLREQPAPLLRQRPERRGSRSECSADYIILRYQPVPGDCFGGGYQARLLRWD
jgi:hypothetical protein